jgi:hypothetical protein
LLAQGGMTRINVFQTLGFDHLGSGI